MLQPLKSPGSLLRESWITYQHLFKRIIPFGIAIGLLTYVNQAMSLSTLFRIILNVALVYLGVKIAQLVFANIDNVQNPTIKPAVTARIVTWIILLSFISNISLRFFITTILLSFIAGMGGMAILLFSPVAYLIAFAIFIYPVTRLSSVLPNMIDRAENPINAVKYSWEITKHRFLDIVWRNIVIGLIAGAINIAIRFTGLEHSIGTQAVVNIIFAPYLIIYLITLYRDLEKTATIINPAPPNPAQSPS